MAEIVEGLGLMCMVAVLAMLLVIVAMAVDLVSGIRKAKLRGEARTSYGFSRSLTKFLLYQGILLISTCIDMLLHFGLYQFTEMVYVIPCVELIMAVILCGVELWSVWEKAEAKERRRATQIAQAGAQLIDKDKLTELLAETIGNALKKTKETEEAEETSTETDGLLGNYNYE